MSKPLELSGCHLQHPVGCQSKASLQTFRLGLLTSSLGFTLAALLWLFCKHQGKREGADLNFFSFSVLIPPLHTQTHTCIKINIYYWLYFQLESWHGYVAVVEIVKHYSIQISRKNSLSTGILLNCDYHEHRNTKTAGYLHRDRFMNYLQIFIVRGMPPFSPSQSKPWCTHAVPFRYSLLTPEQCTIRTITRWLA